MPLTSINNNKRVIYGFTGLEDYRDFIRNQSEQLNQHNHDEFDRLSAEGYVRNDMRDPRWYGPNATYEDITGHMTQFQNPELIESVYDRIKDRMPAAIRSKLQEKKMRFNDLAGVFSMDRFMMAMYKRPAFWSVKKQAFVPPTEVYQDKQGEWHLKIDNSEVEKQEKLATHNKNVFSYFPILANDSKALEIMIVAGANAGTGAAEMMYTGITGILISELCERAGIKCKINIIIGSSNGPNTSVAVIPMKEFARPVDRNVIALMASDPRVFRYEMFKGIICNWDKFGFNVPGGLGSLVTEQQARDMFETNPALKKQVFSTDRVFYTSGIFTEADVFTKIDQILNQLTHQGDEN